MDQAALEMINAHKSAVADFEKYSMVNIDRASQIIVDSLRSGGILYLCGNGGSAADCQHIAGEFIGRFRKERRSLPAVALTTDSSILSCLGNDYDFAIVFSRQVEGLLKDNDILWVFSTSGTSKNIIAAVETAQKKGCKIIAFTGKAESPLEKAADACICARTQFTSTAQEIHQLAYHMICNIVEQKMFS
jgi:D-sedoheptulose 7-phosphate isomerase